MQGKAKYDPENTENIFKKVPHCFHSTAPLMSSAKVKGLVLHR
jgi:hypothetical protein